MFKKSPREPEPTSPVSAEFGPQPDSSDFEIEFDLDSLLAEGGPRSEAAEPLQFESGYFDDSDLENILTTQEEEPGTGFWPPSTDEDDEEIFDLSDLAPDSELEDETGRYCNSPASTVFLTDGPLPARPGTGLKADEPELPPYGPLVRPTNNMNEIQDFDGPIEELSSAWPGSGATGDLPEPDINDNCRFQQATPENHDPAADSFKRFQGRASVEAAGPLAWEPALTGGDDLPVLNMDIGAESTPEADDELFVVGTEDHDAPELFGGQGQAVFTPPKKDVLYEPKPERPDEEELIPAVIGLPTVKDLGNISGPPQGAGPGETPADTEPPMELSPEIPGSLRASRPNGSVVLPPPLLNSTEIIALLEDQPEQRFGAKAGLRSGGRKSRRRPGSSPPAATPTPPAAGVSPEALAALIETAVEKAVTRALKKNMNSLLTEQLPTVLEQAAEGLAASLSRHFKPKT